MVSLLNIFFSIKYSVQVESIQDKRRLSHVVFDGFESLNEPFQNSKKIRKQKKIKNKLVGRHLWYLDNRY